MKTLKFSIILLFLTSIWTLGFSQTEPDSKSGKGGFGIKGGPTFSTIGFDNEDARTQKNRFRVGGMAGFSYEAATEGSFAFEIDFLYDLRGTKQDAELPNGNELEIKNYLHYAHFPASFKFYIGDNFNIHFGGYASGLMAGKAKETIWSSSGEFVQSSDYSLTNDNAQDVSGNDYLKRVDAGVHGGIEFISNGGFGVGGRFSKGLVDITNDDHVFGSGNARTSEVSIYFIFRL